MRSISMATWQALFSLLRSFRFMSSTARKSPSFSECRLSSWRPRPRFSSSSLSTTSTAYVSLFLSKVAIVLSALLRAQDSAGLPGSSSSPRPAPAPPAPPSTPSPTAPPPNAASTPCQWMSQSLTPLSSCLHSQRWASIFVTSDGSSTTTAGAKQEVTASLARIQARLILESGLLSLFENLRRHFAFDFAVKPSDSNRAFDKSEYSSRWRPSA
mmetsp:Transcript_8203/g.20258  ORF Transcript_8203/g.20258 Transcript_8203/m.20258 type:complete len:213 (-) Transcript_8203:117-755(-)